MSLSQQRVHVIVDDDGTVKIPAADIARLGGRPGEHLELIHEESDETPNRRKSIRGIGVGKVPTDELLAWEDFEVGQEANVETAETRYGTSST